MNNFKTVKLQFDYLQGPIWISDFETGEPLTGIEIIDNDHQLAELNYECSLLYSDCYEFDSHGETCWFNKDRLIENRTRLLDLLNEIKDRINFLCNGEILIEDLATLEIEQY